MTPLDLLLAALIIAAIVLIIFLIKFLRDLTESINTSVDSVKNIEKSIEEIKSEISPTVKNINEITTKTAELTRQIETDYSFIGAFVSSLKDLFAKQNHAAGTAEVSEARISETIENVKAVSKGVRTFFGTLRNRKS
jgi:uncharacterized protein YoxC